MNKPISRRTFLKKSLGTLATVTGLGIGGSYYAHNLEPKWLEIKHNVISHPLIPKGFHGMKMIQFSDTHLGFQFQLKDLQAIVNKINQLDPDVILFTGDLMDQPNKYKAQQKIPSVLNQLKAPLGKFSIYGNHDHGGYGSEIYSDIMKKSHFTMLQNTSTKITLLTAEEIFIAGVDDAMLGKPDFEKALAGIPEGVFTIMLSHAPDLADTSRNYDIQYQISGHSHGGQVQIPFAGALVTPPYAEKYREGTYEIDSLTLHVNRGLGTTRLPYRFLSRPELTVYEFQAKK
ncbi:metallophosphoesterase [Peribacillus sp. NJ11]|uniref:metallophosphoesterase n=1 Tax=Peribacillus sp. NJ11 TaxID=3055861 RepID=UPI0025A272C9|nr:metallophosphoesterase [Peribacillus sp. NJ11]MDM5223941.1 metallophosphoesterase [Peribacillus sp. NJ11]